MKNGLVTPQKLSSSRKIKCLSKYQFALKSEKRYSNVDWYFYELFSKITSLM